MRFVSEPPVAVKIQKMKQRVRWQQPCIVSREIDQTRMILDDGRQDSREFSFLVVGDSGSGQHYGHSPQREVAEMMLNHRDECRFVLHTGDVVYLVGSSEYYRKNFMEPYCDFLVGGENLKSITYDRMVFKLPFLPVLGNHDYYDLPVIFGLLSGSSMPLRRLLRYKLDLDIGWHGSFQGHAYARAFLDYLKALDKEKLERHLDHHYTGKTDTGRCLVYEPGSFTRLPNRYYTFRYGGIDFFALDSNTFNAPLPLPATQQGVADRDQLEKRRNEVEEEKQRILETSNRLNPNIPEDAEKLEDLQAKLEQLDEVTLDIDKQLASNAATDTDFEQLDWLRDRLIESWNTKEVRGRVIYFHHPPYVTEATKWYQAQTLAVRHRLRLVLNAVADAVGNLPEGRPLVDLVFNGHAHCLEYLRTLDTGHADSNINWIISGGSGFSLRRQRQEGPELMEGSRKVAYSDLFIGRTGQGSQKRRPYSFVRIDVRDGCPPKFVVRPFVAERFQGQWLNREMESFVI